MPSYSNLGKKYRTIEETLNSIQYDTVFNKTDVTSYTLGPDKVFNKTDVTSYLGESDKLSNKTDVTSLIQGSDKIFNKTDVTSYIIGPDKVFDKTDVTSYIGDSDKLFDKTSMVDRYSAYDFSITKPSGGSILDNYYRTYGYTAGVATVGGFLAGTHSATDVASNLLSLVPGVSRGTVGAFLIDSANTALRSPVVSDYINNLLPSPNLLGFGNEPFKNSKIAPAQILPGERFLANSIGSEQSSGFSLLDLAKSSVGNLITNVASTGTVTTYDIQRTFESGLNAKHIEQMSRLGLKYTQNVGFLDPTYETWKSGKSSKIFISADGNVKQEKPEKIEGITFDKYSGYKDKSESYGNTHDIATLDGSDIVNKYKEIFGDTPSEHKFENFIVQPTSPNSQNRKIPEEKYSNDPKLLIDSETISPNQYLTRLGFPTSNFTISGESGPETLDRINTLDVGGEYTEELRDAIKFMFEDMSSGPAPVPIIFRATLSNLSDSITPSWDEFSFIGRADKFYMYTGFTRNLSFDFTVYVNSTREIRTNWRKINRLYGMCYPVSYENKIAMKAPILKLTIGDMYGGVYGKIDSLTITPHADSFWELEDGLQLPQVVSINLSFTIMYEPNTAVDNDGNRINLPPITNAHHFIHDKSKTKFKSKVADDLIIRD